jgi:hypothetical protein
MVIVDLITESRMMSGKTGIEIFLIDILMIFAWASPFGHSIRKRIAIKSNAHLDFTPRTMLN